MGSARAAHEGADVRHPAATDLAHHLSHLVELLDQPVDVLDCGARPLGDPQAARALDQLGAPPSSLVISTPSNWTASAKRSATLTASCPVIASTTSRMSWGFTAALMRTSSAISSSST